MMMNKLLNNESGQSTAMAALFILLLLAFTGLLIDSGILIAEKTRLVEATSAAAESAVCALDEEAMAESGGIVIDLPTAKLLVESILKMNIPEAELLKCEIDPAAPNQVLVETKLTVETHFFKVLKSAQYVDLKVKATARVKEEAP